MNKSPAFQFYASDFLIDTSAWTAEEVGVYVRMLALQWINGCVPPASDKPPNRLALMCGVSGKCFRRVWGQVGKKFVVGNDGNLRNMRLECEREKQAAFREQKSSAGIAGAQKRWNPTGAVKQTDSTAIALPLADAVAKNSSSSSSSSVNKKQEQGATRASEEPDGPVWKTEEECEARVMAEFGLETQEECEARVMAEFGRRL